MAHPGPFEATCPGRRGNFFSALPSASPRCWICLAGTPFFILLYLIRNPWDPIFINLPELVERGVKRCWEGDLHENFSHCHSSWITPHFPGLAINYPKLSSGCPLDEPQQYWLVIFRYLICPPQRQWSKIDLHIVWGGLLNHQDKIHEYSWFKHIQTHITEL